jgi:uncharacterized protein (TIGR00369 family)
MSLAIAIATARETGDFSAVVDAVPYFRFLDLRIQSRGDGLVCWVPPADHLIGNPVLPAVHGGVVGALMEAAAMLQLMQAADTDQVPRTIDLGVDYLRSARANLPVRARGIISRHGRRVANVRCEAWQDDPAKPVATAHGHWLLA